MLCFIRSFRFRKNFDRRKIFRQDQKIITYTTRRPRTGEQDQKDYYFVSPEEFNQMINDRAFVEWDEYAGNKYGSSKKKSHKSWHRMIATRF